MDEVAGTKNQIQGKETNLQNAFTLEKEKKQENFHLYNMWSQTSD